MKAGRALLLAAAALLGASHVSHAGGSQAPTRLQHWWQRIGADLDALVEQHRLVPPTPVKLRFRARQIWSGDLSGELLDLEVADLGNDGQDELIALTSDSLLVLSRRRGLFDVRMRVALPLAVATRQSRDAIGMLSVRERQNRFQGVVTSEVEVRARSSKQGVGGTYSWKDGTFTLDSEFFGYSFCEAGTIEAVPGRNYFLGASAAWSPEPEIVPVLSSKVQLVRCSRRLVDPKGIAVGYLSDVSLAGTLTVRCQGSREICSAAPGKFTDVGYAHLVSDLNNDGRVEVVTTQASARGDGDRVQVFTRRGRKTNLLFDREFERGVVALAAGDFDGDGALELLAAERQVSSGKVSLWLLN